MSGKNGFQTSAERKENGGCPATAPGAARRCHEAACGARHRGSSSRVADESAVVVADVELEPQPLLGAPALQPLAFLLGPPRVERTVLTCLDVEPEPGAADAFDSVVLCIRKARTTSSRRCARRRFCRPRARRRARREHTHREHRSQPPPRETADATRAHASKPLAPEVLHPHAHPMSVAPGTQSALGATWQRIENDAAQPAARPKLQSRGHAAAGGPR
jgi:hypothetical protein